ncbi:hypothetical protein E2562_002279 [Oryza meyeriana var. granulata]|uniref:Retrovirus-related Pol polyprotein from transposon TNT 1-94-like beta-barrel domain-containing protein n=1 Tax=Oryza meyeriana var. granulata TaxID=110450 RepID=A0A6G1BIN2_9ORYZ|nr:hypothetical protein E2562_002279 [Oryza meyeriana var. granulata]
MATRPAARRPKPKWGQTAAAITITEVDPAHEDPDILDAIRKRNSAAIASILDPIDDHSIKDSPNADDALWHMGAQAHHITDKLNLLADLMPVHNRWVRTLDTLPMQVFARGSVNHKGFVLQDVWYVPGCNTNVVSIHKLAELGLRLSISGDTCEIKNDGVLVGKGRKTDHLCELEFLNTISGVPWYLASNATEHMTGDMFLLTDFTSTQPGRPVRTHTGNLLQVQGKGFLRSNNLAVPDVSYVPGLTENIISLNQLTDSGFDVIFNPDGCRVVRRDDAQWKVGKASRSGGQLYRINYLKTAPKDQWLTNHVSC